ncbi:MAG: response regulator [Sedimentisphaerales bacterium]|nr:response regulator [Sedimentisphaerales bacterium]
MYRKSVEEILRSPIPGVLKTGQVQTSEDKDAIIASKSRFIDNMAYQIRTLTNAIVGFSDLLRQEELTDSQREYVIEIYNSGQGLAALVSDVLDLSKIENGQLEIEKTDCSLGPILEEIESLMFPSAMEKGLDFRIEQKCPLPGNIRTDPNRLRQCLINLAGNAIKFTASGHVWMQIGLEKAGGQTYLRFDVEDSGVGISEDKVATIFEPYAGRDEANQSILASLSHGLVVNSGLAVANQLVRLLGGKIGVSSEVGQGSVFTLVIPVDAVSETGPAQARSGDGASQKKLKDSQIGRCQGKLLFVEDQPSNQTVISLLLEAMGLEVTLAEDGVEAVEKASEEPFDLILMDIKMPRMDGNEAVRLLREKGLVCPIIALSAAGVQADPHFDDFMAKPVDSRSLYRMMSKYLPVAENDPAGWNAAAVKS